jgi:hypothetical protein
MNLLQYGCGGCAPKNWLNYDASRRLWLERLPFMGQFLGGRIFDRNVRYGDIVSGLPMPDESCRAIYCSHVLEHLALDELRSALVNTRKLLASASVFRLVIPDLRRYVDDYLQDESTTAATTFMARTRLGQQQRKSLTEAVRQYFGRSAHLWMWDFAGMKKELLDAGFTGVRRAVLGDSEIEEYSEVESSRRWAGHLGIECRRR